MSIFPRISPRLSRPLALLAILIIVAFVGHASFLQGRYTLKRRDQHVLTDDGSEHIEELIDNEEPLPSELPSIPPVICPWLPNPTWEFDFPREVLTGPKQDVYYMHNDRLPALVIVPPPSSHICSDDPSFGPLLLVGVFSTASSWEQRAVMRTLQRRGLNARSPAVDFRFILGQPDASNPQEAEIIQLEHRAHGDIVVLDIEENMDEGKTYAFFQWASRLPEGAQPRFIMKADQDTFLILPNVLASFSELSCSELVYWGTWWGSCMHCYPLYMRGLAYALSWPLVAWLGSASLSGISTKGIEDIRTAGWFASLPDGAPVKVVDMKTRMGDWYGGTIPHDVHTVALHAMKNTEFWIEVAQEMVGIWKTAGWEYTWPPSTEE